MKSQWRARKHSRERPFQILIMKSWEAIFNNTKAALSVNRVIDRGELSEGVYANPWRHEIDRSRQEKLR